MATDTDSPPSRVWFRWMPVVVWCGLIYWGSTDALSANHTSHYLTPFLHWLVPSLSDDQIGTVRMVIRKGGHVTEYLVLAALLFRALSPDRVAGRWPMRAAALAWVGATLYAASDEVHQSFHPSRQGSALDVGIDSSGALLGLVLLYWFGRWRGQWRAG
ncbi:MAG: VanZ family protein [Verrucomicrobia bacterium]|nr:MAG: VanZ family protein [Verrucomicrobiota bacterium]